MRARPPLNLPPPRPPHTFQLRPALPPATPPPPPPHPPPPPPPTPSPIILALKVHAAPLQLWGGGLCVQLCHVHTLGVVAVFMRACVGGWASGWVGGWGRRAVGTHTRPAAPTCREQRERERQGIENPSYSTQLQQRQQQQLTDQTPAPGRRGAPAARPRALPARRSSPQRRWPWVGGRMGGVQGGWEGGAVGGAARRGARLPRPALSPTRPPPLSRVITLKLLGGPWRVGLGLGLGGWGEGGGAVEERASRNARPPPPPTPKPAPRPPPPACPWVREEATPLVSARRQAPVPARGRASASACELPSARVRRCHACIARMKVWPGVAREGGGGGKGAEQTARWEACGRRRVAAHAHVDRRSLPPPPPPRFPSAPALAWALTPAIQAISQPASLIVCSLACRPTQGVNKVSTGCGGGGRAHRHSASMGAHARSVAVALPGLAVGQPQQLEHVLLPRRAPPAAVRRERPAGGPPLLRSRVGGREGGREEGREGERRGALWAEGASACAPCVGVPPTHPPHPTPHHPPTHTHTHPRAPTCPSLFRGGASSGTRHSSVPPTPGPSRNSLHVCMASARQGVWVCARLAGWSGWMVGWLVGWACVRACVRCAGRGPGRDRGGRLPACQPACPPTRACAARAPSLPHTPIHTHTPSAHPCELIPMCTSFAYLRRKREN